MDFITGLLQGASWIGVILLIILIAAVAYFIVKSRWKAAKGNQVLVISGTSKGVRAIKGGGKFVSPFHEVDVFTTSVLMLKLQGRETPTKDKIQVIVDCTAQIAPDDSSEEQLIKAYQGYYGEYTPQVIIESLQETLMGELRTVIGDLTPEQLLHEKEDFNQRVTEGVAKLMTGLGFTLKSLNLGDVTDNDGYIDDLSAEEREGKRESAANFKANSAKNIAVVQAEANRAAQEAKIASELDIDEHRRDSDIQMSKNKAQRDQAAADADVAGELRRTERAKEVAANKGAVAVVEAEQDQRAAEAQRAAVITRTETDKERQRIQAEATKEQRLIEALASQEQAKIDAEAAAAVIQKRAEGEAGASQARAKGQAAAAEAEALGKAKAAEAEAVGRANATNLMTEAEAKRVRETGLAEAEAIRARGLAEAAAQLEQGKATAEAERLLAEARAANEGVNLQIALAEIESRTRVSIATALGTAMHEVGTNATIIDMGGGSSAQGGLLGSFLGGIPELVKLLDVKSQALNGGSFGETVGNLFTQVAGNNTPQVLEPTEEASKQ